MSAINSGDERAQWNAMRRLSEVSDELPTNMCFLCSLQWQCYQCTGARVVQWWSSEQVKSALALSCPNEENRRGAVVVVVVTSYQTGVSVIVGSSLGLTKASGVIEVMLIVPSMLFGDTELRDWPATIDSEPMLPEMKGASAPKLRMPTQVVRILKLLNRRLLFRLDVTLSFKSSFNVFTLLMQIRTIVHVGRWCGRRRWMTVWES